MSASIGQPTNHQPISYTPSHLSAPQARISRSGSWCGLWPQSQAAASHPQSQVISDPVTYALGTPIFSHLQIIPWPGHSCRYLPFTSPADNNRIWQAYTTPSNPTHCVRLTPRFASQVFTHAGGSSRAFAVRGVVLFALLFLARAKNPATAQLGKWVMTGLMIEMVCALGSVRIAPSFQTVNRGSAIVQQTLHMSARSVLTTLVTGVLRS